MSLDLSNYDFYVHKGDTLRYDFIYRDSSGTPVDLTSYVGRMQIRRSPYYSNLLGELNEGFPEGCYGRGLSGDFSAGEGITGTTGGLVLNYESTNGKIHIEVDAQTTGSIPAGKHNYDLDLYDSVNDTRTTVLRGRFEVLPNTIKG